MKGLLTMVQYLSYTQPLISASVSVLSNFTYSVRAAAKGASSATIGRNGGIIGSLSGTFWGIAGVIDILQKSALN
jgi:hypothetical protein